MGLARSVLSAALVSVVAGRAAAQGPPPAAPPPPPPQAVDVEPVPDKLPVQGPGDEEAKADFQESRPVPDGSPLRISNRFLTAALYGFAELDYLHDSTQSFQDRSNNFSIARPGTVMGENDQAMIVPCNSRLGAHVGTPAERSVRGIFLVELGSDYRDDDEAGRCRSRGVRHLYFALRSPIVDLLVGRYYGLFGWGGKGFFPNTAAFLGVPGQIYRLKDQIRVSHIFRARLVDFEIALAPASSVQSTPGAAEGHFGLRFAFKGWRGASAQGAGPPEASPLQVGVSSVGRILEVNPFTALPSTPIKAYARGLAVDAFVPLVPARGADLWNALSLTFEWSRTSGLADMYPGLTGGVLFPALPNPQMGLPPPVYYTLVPPGLATFDASGVLHLIDWEGVVLGMQYHPPLGDGRRVWLSGTLSWTSSDNAAELTPVPGQPFVWAHGFYYDLNLFVAPLRALQVALSYQVTRQEFADRAVGRNARGQVAAAYFF
jgi:hypothetical protein